MLNALKKRSTLFKHVDARRYCCYNYYHAVKQRMSSSETVTETIITATNTATESATATATATAAAEEAADAIVRISIRTPIVYLTILVATLIIFSVFHRRSKINSLRSLTTESLFEPAYPATPNAPLPTPDSTPAVMYTDLTALAAHEKLLKTALVDRAAESLRRIVKLKETEQSVLMLYTRGLIGDDSFKRYQLQVKLQDAEMQEIAVAAESFKPGWSKSIFASAQEVMMNLALRRRVNCVSERAQLADTVLVTGVEEVVKGIQDTVQKYKTAKA